MLPTIRAILDVTALAQSILLACQPHLPPIAPDLKSDAQKGIPKNVPLRK
jgi:hypothetical protein